jgi:hypothetical protein
VKHVTTRSGDYYFEEMPANTLIEIGEALRKERFQPKGDKKAVRPKMKRDGGRRYRPEMVSLILSRLPAQVMLRSPGKARS